MNQNKKGSMSNLTCSTCKVDFSSNADYALHEFSKKHCDNLIRLAKRKPVVSKQKNKSKSSEGKKESSKINTLTHTGSFAKYGYFIPGEIYAHAEMSKEFNTDYDPYLQKFAENSLKEKPVIPTPSETPTFCSVTCFSKKKKKKIKRCQVCNVTLSTVPEYEAHMKSPQHIWKLKITGMGVSAHFIKASSNLHTTDINEESTPINQTSNEQIPVDITISNKNVPSGPYPLLYCNDCELLLSSLQQYNAHINGKYHVDCVQKKAELRAKKEKLENPSPNQLYCYSCKISLNNLFQYNEHKNGKKHKIKCRNLVKKGVTIPPEERIPGIPFCNSKNSVVYPELYEKLMLEKQKQELKSSHQLSHHTENSLVVQGSSGYSEEQEINSNYSIKSANNLEIQKCPTVTTPENHVSSVEVPKLMFLKNDTSPLVNKSTLNNSIEILEVNNSQMNISSCQVDSQSDSVRLSEEELKNEIRIITDNKPVECSICRESFQSQVQLDIHLGTEAHLTKILELKKKRRSDSEILNAIFSDRNVIKPCNMGKLTCSVCTVTTDNKAEFDQHLNSIVHKYTLKDYRMKRTVEVKNMVSSNGQGLYFCKLCKEGWSSLLEYTQHLHLLKHKTAQKAQRAKVILAKRKTSHLQKQRLKHLKNKASLRRIEIEKNPGIRTKVCGVAVDLQSGIQAPIPNLESLEPKIDLTKNLGIGTHERENGNTAPSNISSSSSSSSSCNNNSNNNNNNHNHHHHHHNHNNGDDDDANDKLKERKIKKIQKSNRKLQNPGRKQRNDGPYSNSMPLFRSPRNRLPQLSYQPRFSRPSYGPPNRNWVPYSSLYSPVFEPFFDRFTSNPYIRPPWFQRLPWSRYK